MMDTPPINLLTSFPMLIFYIYSECESWKGGGGWSTLNWLAELASYKGSCWTYI